jgi:hypothetical protein
LTLAFALMLACTLLPPLAHAKHAKARDTGVINVSQSPGLSEAEEPLAVDPRNPHRLTTVANVFHPNAPPPFDKVFGGGGIDDTRVYSSRDAGLHWTTRKLDQGGLGPLQLPLPPLLGFAPEFSDALNIINTDADSIWDRHGNAYFESGDIHGIHHGGNEVASVWRSGDGGMTWEPPGGYVALNATAELKELDRPWFAVDNSGGPHDGRLYLTFETTPFAPIPPEVYVKHSDDRGRTWSPTVRVDDGIYETQFNARAKPVVGGAGVLYVVYDRASIMVTPFTPQTAPIQLVVARSVDGGQTFKRAEADPDVHRIQSPDEATDVYTEVIPAIAADPVHRNRVAIAWPEAEGGSSSRIMLRYSRDGGRSWIRRIDVADDPATTPNQHDHVTLSWYRDGRLFVGWRDRRCCGGSFADPYEQFVRVLNPPRRRHVRRPAAFRLVPGTTVRFTTEPEPPNASGRGALAPDEFQGLVATPLGVALTWSRLTGSLDDLMFRRIPLRAFQAKRAKRVSPPRPGSP